MRAVICREFAPLDRLAVAELPDPSPGPREVVVRVAAAGLNYADALLAQGKYQARPPLPFAPGMELAGTVAAVGAAVRELRVGEPVMATVEHGAFAELCLAPVERVLRRPAGLAAEVAAGTLVTYGTTVHALRHRARLQPFETVLVLGAAGGAGTAAVGVARLLGARVIAAASSPERLELCRAIGAHATVDYRREDLRARVRELTGGRGVDVVYDAVGGPLAEVALRATAWGGRHLVVGFAAGEIPRIPLNLALLGERTVLGVFCGEWTRRNRTAADAMYAEIAGWMSTGQLAPAITARLAIGEIPRGLADLVARRVVGKTVAVLER
jgi:NADPH2:quinone reductase